MIDNRLVLRKQKEEDLEENNEKNDDKINRQTALTKKFQFRSRHQVVSYKE